MNDHFDMDATAGVGRRALALAIDGVVFAVLFVISLAAFGERTSGVLVTPNGTMTTHGVSLHGWMVLLPVAFWFAYAIAAEALAGATLRKFALGLRVVAADGSRAGLLRVVVRNALRVVDVIGFYLVGAVAAWTSPTRQRVGDRVAGTRVVRHRAFAVAPPPPLDRAANTWGR
jgi:uncharacterized RDD family membrane protein YckC